MIENSFESAPLPGTSKEMKETAPFLLTSTSFSFFRQRPDTAPASFPVLFIIGIIKHCSNLSHIFGFEEKTARRKKERGKEKRQKKTLLALPRLSLSSLSPSSSSPLEVARPAHDDAYDHPEEPQRRPEDLHHQDFHEQRRVGRVRQRRRRANDADAEPAREVGPPRRQARS